MTGPTPSIVGMVDDLGRPATIYTPPEVLRRDPNRWPTPEEFVSEWEQHAPAARLAMAEQILANAQLPGRVAALAADWAVEGFTSWAEQLDALLDHAAAEPEPGS